MFHDITHDMYLPDPVRKRPVAPKPPSEPPPTGRPKRHGRSILDVLIQKHFEQKGWVEKGARA